MKIKLKSLDKLSLELYVIFLKKLFLKVNIKNSFLNFPVKKKRITLLKSPHVNKRALEQFEIKIYSVIVSFSSISAIKFFYFNKPKNIRLTTYYNSRKVI